MTKEELFEKTAKFISTIHGFEIQYTREKPIDGVTDLQFDLLQVLYFSGPYSMSGLSLCLNTNLPNTSREVKKMVLAGFVIKEASQHDRRQTMLSLTEKGRKLVEGALEDMKNQFFRTSGEWTDERIAKCLESMRILEREIFSID